MIDEDAKANLEFHTAIHKASGNAWSVRQLDQIQSRINVYQLMPYKVVGRLQKSFAEHCEICEAIITRDGLATNALMRDHMMLQGSRLPNLIKTLE